METEKGKTGEEQSQEHAYIKNLSWQAKQSILHITITFYGNCMKMCEDFTPNFGDKRTGCCTTTPHCLALHFSPGKF
jgi:hypothetical protein